MLYHVGDRVLCRINASSTIVFDADFNDYRYQQFKVRSFEVVATYQNYYIVLCWPGVDDSRTLDQEMLDQFSIPKKHLGRHVVLIRELAVGGRETIDPYKHPLQCRVCKEYFPYAEANQDDGSLICWVCRHTRLLH